MVGELTAAGGETVRRSARFVPEQPGGGPPVRIKAPSGTEAARVLVRCLALCNCKAPFGATVPRDRAVGGT